MASKNRGFRKRVLPHVHEHAEGVRKYAHTEYSNELSEQRLHEDAIQAQVLALTNIPIGGGTVSVFEEFTDAGNILLYSYSIALPTGEVRRYDSGHETHDVGLEHVHIAQDTGVRKTAHARPEPAVLYSTAYRILVAEHAEPGDEKE